MNRRESIVKAFEAARAGRTAELVSFLATGVSPDQSSPEDFYALRLLHETVVGCHADTVAAVIACGADKQARDRGGNCPLSLSSTMGARDTSLVLLAAGADADAPNKQGVNQEALARQHGHHDLADIIKRINVARHAHAPSSPRPSPDPSPGAISELFDAMSGGRMLDLLEGFAAGAALDCRNPAGEALTHVGARRGHESDWCRHAEALAIALACGVPVDARDEDGATGLHVGAAAGSYYACLIQLAAGAAAGAKDRNGMTPPERARHAGHAPLASLIENIALARAFAERSRSLAMRPD